MISEGRTASEVDNSFGDSKWIESLGKSRLEKPLGGMLGMVESEEDNMNTSEVVDN